MTNLVKSIQAVSITIGAAATSNTATITSVDLTKAIILYQGELNSTASAIAYQNVATRIELTNATTVTATRGASSNAVTVNAVVVEFLSGVNSIQAGTIALSTVQTSNTATISAVGANGFVIWLGASTATASTFANAATSVTLTNSTTVTAAVGVANSALTIGYMAVDLDGTILNSAPQQGAHTDATASTSYTDTITSVTAANSIVVFNGVTMGAGGTGTLAHTVVMTNGTTITMTRSSGTITNSRTINYAVLEFVAAILQSSVQRGTIVLAAATSNTATVTSVNTSYAFANWNGFSVANGNANVTNPDLALTNGTTVTAAVSSAGSPTVGYEVIEFAPPAAAGNDNIPLWQTLGMGPASYGVRA